MMNDEAICNYCLTYFVIFFGVISCITTIRLLLRRTLVLNEYYWTNIDHDKLSRLGNGAGNNTVTVISFVLLRTYGTEDHKPCIAATDM
jgi:hypothetical protein